MATIEESLDYLLEVESQNQRLDRLIRQGMLPARQLPILHRALANMRAGKILPPYEREAISKLLDKMMNFQFGDDVTYNRARLHTQKTKYQTEEKKVAKDKEGDVVVYDGSEDESEAKRDKKVKKNGKSKILKSNKGDGIKSDEEINEGEQQELASINKDKKVQSKVAAARPADEGQEEGDQESPKQGGSVKPEITDGPKQMSKPDIREGLLADLDQEGRRKRDARRFKRAGRRSKEELLKALPAALRKEKLKTESALSDDLQKFNKLYKQNLETALANRGVDNVRDIPEDSKEDIFKQVDEASYSKKQIKMAKGIAFDKRHKAGDMTGAYKKAEKIKKGLGDHPEVSAALRAANENVEQQLDELSPKTISSYQKKAGAQYRQLRKDGPTKEQDIENAFHQGYTSNKEYFKQHDNLEKMKKRGKGLAMSKGKGVKKEEKELNIFDTRRAMKEGAREDAMKDMRSKDATKGMAPVKSSKDWAKSRKSKHDGSENKGPAHIVAQLRSVLDQGDKHAGVKFQDGKTHKVSVGHAHKFLNKYMSGKPADKMKMQSHGHASHDNFKKHLD